MKRFAEFWHESTGWNGNDFSGPIKLIPACGSDSVLPMDARYCLARLVEQAREVARRRGYSAFRIMRVVEPHSPFTGAQPLTKLHQTTHDHA